MSCEPPLVPRWLILQEHGKMCVCLGLGHFGNNPNPNPNPNVHDVHGVARGSAVGGSDGDGGDRGAPSVDEAEPDDNEMPHRYKACEASASSCTARTG